MRFLGIDFSGGAAPWRRTVKNPTVWIASVLGVGNTLALDDVRPVQQLPGSQDCFERLVELLKSGDFTGAGIDAPFSIPVAHMPSGGHGALLELVMRLPNGKDRSFPHGADIVRIAEMNAKLTNKKPLRKCEQYWAKQGVRVRSTLWNGIRGGAPFAASCMSLLVRAGRPIWPWSDASSGTLVEAFPAAQLCFWNLPFLGYSNERSGTDAAARCRIVDTRRHIIDGISGRIELSGDQKKTLELCPDALDAVIAAFAAVAVARGTIGVPADDPTDGWIAVHK